MLIVTRITSSLFYTKPIIQTKKKEILRLVRISFLRAKDGTQTRDPQLGRLMLYQLSYFREIIYYLSFTIYYLKKWQIVNCKIVNQKMWAVKDSNLRSRKTAELQSAPVGHFGNCPFVFLQCKDRFKNSNYQIILAIFMAVIAPSTPLFPSIPPALSRACCKVLVVSTPKITGQPSVRVFRFEIPDVTP